MVIRHIKKGDTVEVLRGKDRKKTGKVVKVDHEKGRLMVEGVNVYKKHVRPKRQGEKGEIVEVSRALPIPAVAVFCSDCGRGVRVGFEIKEGVKTRFCRKCGKKI